MKASQSAFGAQATSMAGMQDKLAKLGAIYDAQSQKVQLIAAQLEKAKAEYGDNSKQADQLRIALNRATAQMNGTKAQIDATEGGLQTLAQAQELVGDETDSTNMTLQEAEKVLKDAAGKADDLADSSEDAGEAVEDEGGEAKEAASENSKLREAMQKAGEVAGGVMVTGLKAAGAALAAMATAAGAAIKTGFEFAQSAGTYADDVATLATQTGVSTQRLQEWSYASNLIDTSVDTITGSMNKLTQTMGQAADGNEAAQKKFVELGIAIEDFDGNLRSSEDVFWDAIDALGKIENPTERDAAAMALFGKSAKELNPLIEAGSRAWRDLGKEAQAMGTVFSEENLAKMGAFDDAMTRNVTYRLDALVDCPVEIVLPEIQDDGYGAWFEMQLRQKANAYSLTLVPPEGVKVASNTLANLNQGVNVLDLQYSDVDDVQVWRALNTNSKFTESTPALASIAFRKAPDTVSYAVGDALDLTGAEVVATFEDGHKKLVTTGCTFTPASGATLTAEDTTLTAAYTVGDVTATATVALTITDGEE